MRIRWFHAAAAAAAAAALALWLLLPVPYGGFSGDTYVDIPRGAGSSAIAARLARAGVVRTRWHFLAARALRWREKLQAGEYKFSGPATAWQVLGRLRRGDVFYYELRVPEGYNMFDIAQALDKQGIIGGDAFLRAARDASLVRDLAPEAPALEGYLFPDTYRVTRRTTAGQLCAMMTNRFRKAWSELGVAGPAHPLVTLASLVEKETGLDEERPLIASVFANRLSRGMPLDCDPTAVYAALLAGRYEGELLRADLERKHCYNTYQRPGLPPGPIANPGLASLRAAAKPANTPYLYFVARADGSGGHVFSRDLDAHQRAVARYRRANNKKANQTRGARPLPR